MGGAMLGFGLALVILTVSAMSWAGGSKLLTAAIRTAHSDPRCRRCHYILAGLASEAPCPECGDLERTWDVYPDATGRILATCAIAIGGVVLIAAALLAVSRELPFWMAFHALMMAPTAFIGFDYRLSRGQASFMAFFMMGVMGVMMCWATRDIMHSSDVHDTFGLIGIFFIGWLAAGPAYILAAAAIRFTARSRKVR